MDLTNVLRDRIPESELNRVKSSFGPMLDEDIFFSYGDYETLSHKVPKDYTVIDFGCSTAVQCYFFEEHKKYIGIDAFKNERFRCENTEHFICDIGEWIEKNPTLDTKTFAIGFWLTDESINRLIIKKFANHCVPCPSGAFTPEFNSFALSNAIDFNKRK